MDALGLVGYKLGMSRLFMADTGESVPVSVIQVPVHRVVQRKTESTDGYAAVQVSYGDKAAHRCTRAVLGHYRKHQVAPGLGLHEFRLPDQQAVETVAAEYSVQIFEAFPYVDVQGTTKGRGFTGTVKRHNFRTQDMTHGNSRSHRVPGSVGQCQTPGRVFKGKKMAGQYGNEQVSVLSLKLVKIDAEKGLLFVKGAIPGAPRSELVITPAVKRKG